MECDVACMVLRNGSRSPLEICALMALKTTFAIKFYGSLRQAEFLSNSEIIIKKYLMFQIVLKILYHINLFTNNLVEKPTLYSKQS